MIQLSLAQLASCQLLWLVSTHELWSLRRASMELGSERRLSAFCAVPTERGFHGGRRWP